MTEPQPPDTDTHAPEAAGAERRRTWARVSSRLDGIAALLARVPSWVYLIAALAAAVGVFPFHLPAREIILGVPIDTRLVLWAARIGEGATALLFPAGVLYVLRSIADAVERADFAKSVGPIAREATQHVEEQSQEALTAADKIDELEQKLASSTEVIKILSTKAGILPGEEEESRTG